VTDGSGESGRRRLLRDRQGLGRTGARFPRHADTPAPSDDALPTETETETSLAPDGATVDPLVGRTGARFGSRARRAREARAGGPWGLPPRPSAGAPLALPPSSTPSRPLPAPWPDRTPARGVAPGATEPAPHAVDPLAVDPLVGRTGARVDSRARRARRQAKREAAEAAVAPTQAAPVRRRVELGRGGDLGRGGESGRGGETGRGVTVPAPRASWSDAWWAGARWSDARPPDTRPSDAARSDDDALTEPLHLTELRNRVEGIEPRVSVRPYVRTRGRTHARSDLRIETLVSIPSPRPPIDDPEHRAIGELCDGPRSVAEVAALMRVPLGVARILIGDMADEGTLTVHRTLDRFGPGTGPDRAVMARVLRGLRAL
jgi:uncharacterized protein DUF742